MAYSALQDTTILPAPPVLAPAPEVQDEDIGPELSDPLSDPLQMLPLGGGGGGGAPADAPDDEKPRRGGGLIQLLASASSVQRQGGEGEAGVQRAAKHGLSGSGGPMPFGDLIQRSFGRHDVSGVRAHTDASASEGAAAMGARAFASGDHVAFGGSPDLHTAAHEAAHVVQQQGGVQLKGGVGQAGDRYERNADAVADAVVRGERAEALLDPFAGSGGGGDGAVQRELEDGNQVSTATPVHNKVSTPKLSGSSEHGHGGSSSTVADNDWTTEGGKERLQSKVGVGVSVSEGYKLATEFEFKIFGPWGLRVAVDLGVERGASASAEGKRSSTDTHAEREWESNKETSTKFEGSVQASAVFDLFVVKVDVGLRGSLEGEVKGQKSVKEAVQEVVREMFKTEFKDTEERLKNAGAQLMLDYAEARGQVAVAYDEVITMLKSGESASSVQEATTGNYWFGKSPKEKVESAYTGFQKKIVDLFEAVGQVQEGSAASAFFQPTTVLAEIAEAGSAATTGIDLAALATDSQTSGGDQAKPKAKPSAADITKMRIASMETSKAANLTKMDERANKVIGAFNAFQPVAANKSSEVNYKASATLFAGVRFGNKEAGLKGEVKVEAGVMAVQQDGSSTGLMGTAGINGTLEVGEFEVGAGVQVAAGMESRYLSAKAEGKTPELEIPAILDPSRLNVTGISGAIKALFAEEDDQAEGGESNSAATGIWGALKAGVDLAGREFKHNLEEGADKEVSKAKSKIIFGIEYEYMRKNLGTARKKVAVSAGMERSLVGVEFDAGFVGGKVEAGKFTKVQVELSW